MELLRNLVEGLSLLADIPLMAMLLAAVVGGIAVGAIPGLTATLAITLLLPFTFGLSPMEGIAVMTGIYVGGIYGGGITATTMRIPGAPANTLTVLDGYPMARAGHPEAALGLGLFSSVVGGLAGGLVLLFLAPQLAQISLRFQSPEMFSLIVLALVLLTIVGTDSIKRGLAGSILGMMLATVGLDPMLPVPRFTFGSDQMLVGIPLLPMVVGLFALSEILSQADTPLPKGDVAMRPRFSRTFAFLPMARQVGWRLFAKSSVIGSLIGVLPGSGAAVAAFVAYGEAKRSSKHPERFGTGIPEGIIAPETANNAMIGGALVPMLAFGIPGDAVTAVMLGALLIQGIVPGPQLLSNSQTLLVPLVISYFVCNILLLVAGFSLLPFMSRLTAIRRSTLTPTIIAVALLAGYASEGTLFAIGLTVVVGIAGFALQRLGISLVTVLLGAILGPMLEVNFRRSLIISEGDPLIFLRSPVSGFLLFFTALLIVLTVRKRALASAPKTILDPVPPGVPPAP